MNEKYYGLIFKAGIVAILAIWIGLIITAAILITVAWIKVTVIVLIVLIPIVIIVVWLFKNYSGPQ